MPWSKRLESNCRTCLCQKLTFALSKRLFPLSFHGTKVGHGWHFRSLCQALFSTARWMLSIWCAPIQRAVTAKILCNLSLIDRVLREYGNILCFCQGIASFEKVQITKSSSTNFCLFQVNDNLQITLRFHRSAISLEKYWKCSEGLISSKLLSSTVATPDILTSRSLSWEFVMEEKGTDAFKV